MASDLQLGTLDVHSNGRPVKQGKGGLPPGPVRQAMRSHAVESRAWLQDLAFRLPYADYAGKEKLQTYELTLFLVLCDYFEDGSDEDRTSAFVKAGVPTDLTTVRDSRLYKDLMIRVGEELKAMREEEALDPATWVDRETARSQKVISRTLRHTLGVRELAAAAGEVLDRKFPKATRAQGGGNVNVVLWRPEDASLLDKALKTVREISESPVLELTP